MNYNLFIRLGLPLFLTVAILVMLPACSKSGGDTPVPPPPVDTTVITPTDTSTIPPADTTTTPPQDTTSTAGYTNVLVGTFNGLAITDAAMDTTIAEFSTPGVVDISLQSYGVSLPVTAELHAKQPMTVTGSGASQQKIGTWSDVKQVTDINDVQWSDTINHPYVKIINKDKKENVYCLFIENVVNPTTGVVSFHLPAGVTATNETYNKILSRNPFYPLRYFHN